MWNPGGPWHPRTALRCPLWAAGIPVVDSFQLQPQSVPPLHAGCFLAPHQMLRYVPETRSVASDPTMFGNETGKQGPWKQAKSAAAVAVVWSPEGPGSQEQGLSRPSGRRGMRESQRAQAGQHCSLFLGGWMWAQRTVQELLCPGQISHSHCPACHSHRPHPQCHPGH